MRLHQHLSPIFLFLLAGCAGLQKAPPPRPETFVEGVTRRAVLNELTKEMVNAHWRVLEVSEVQASFEKDPGIVEQVFLGMGSHWRMNFTLLESESGVQVLGDATMVSPSGMGRERRDDMTEGAPKKELQQILENLHLALAGNRVTPAAVPAQSAIAPAETALPPKKQTAAPRTTASEAADPVVVHSQATIGAPSSEVDRRAAITLFAEANAFVGSHEWTKAEQSFQKAILFDGSVAKYHAGMGDLMMILHRWTDASASFSAAVLLDVDNPDYRQKLKEARARR